MASRLIKEVRYVIVDGHHIYNALINLKMKGHVSVPKLVGPKAFNVCIGMTVEVHHKSSLSPTQIDCEVMEQL